MKAQNLIDPCVECGLSTAFGSGNFVDRIPTDDGYKCAICAGMECDRCDKRMYIDCDITPEYCGIEDDDHFSDGSRFICEDCLTDNEAIGYNNYMNMENDNG